MIYTFFDSNNATLQLYSIWNSMQVILWVTSHLPWVPEVFLACGGNFRCWPKAEATRVTIKTWQKPETALEKSLAPRVLVTSFRGSSDLTSRVKLAGRIDVNHDTRHFCTPFRINGITAMPVTWYFSPPERLCDIAFAQRWRVSWITSIRLGRLKKRPVRNDLGTGLNGPLPTGCVSKADSS